MASNSSATSEIPRVGGAAVPPPIARAAPPGMHDGRAVAAEHKTDGAMGGSLVTESWRARSAASNESHAHRPPVHPKTAATPDAGDQPDGNGSSGNGRRVEQALATLSIGASDTAAQPWPPVSNQPTMGVSSASPRPETTAQPSTPLIDTPGTLQTDSGVLPQDLPRSAHDTATPSMPPMPGVGATSAMADFTAPTPMLGAMAAVRSAVAMHALRPPPEYLAQAALFRPFSAPMPSLTILHEDAGARIWMYRDEHGAVQGVWPLEQSWALHSPYTLTRRPFPQVHSAALTWILGFVRDILCRPFR